MWVLTIRSPVTGPKEYVLKKGRNTLGRKFDNDIVIADDTASRLHSVIECQPDQIVIQDQNSMNGTYVNRTRITKPYTLKPEDQIRIGQHLATIALVHEIQSINHGDPLSKTQPIKYVVLEEPITHNDAQFNEISSRISTLVDLDLALKEISKLMETAMGVEKFGVILADRFDHLDELGFPSAVAKLAMEQRSVIVIPDLMHSDHTSPMDNNNVEGIRSILCSPIFIEQEIAGLIYAYRTNVDARQFELGDVQMAVAMSQQAALTIQRTRLLEQVRVYGHVAGTDLLTGLPSRRQAFQFGEIEVKRALRYHHPLSVMMIDADNLKEVNDTYGHPVGDQVLQAMITRCKQGLREVDFLGRYGGDEFLAVLVETELGNAHEIAGRIRQFVSDTPIDTGQGPLQLTISVGVAALTQPHLTLSDVVKSADDALYIAKKSGKNKVEVAV
jgi:diguanylate cyclase (GGDEF)-like protein